MGINSMLKEIYALNIYKKRGYSLIEIEGSDADVKTYIKRLSGKKSIEINDNTYPINHKKRKTKGSMTLYRFKEGISTGEDDNGEYKLTKADSKLLNEVVANARAMGQNERPNKKQEMIMMALGAVIGIMLGYILGGVF